MARRRQEEIDELKSIEKDTQVLENLSLRLGLLEGKIDELAISKPMKTSPSTENLQEIVSKITALRDLIDKIEIEIEQLNTRINDIESLRFKHRSGL
ncbi:MAG: hypothetical protein BV458_13410 [Thermoplasmata archaeon M9B2D]|nr:MAG: hypothetical protein BV458_13410 [Thermoplasmata archaeon M9B2D]